MMTRIFAQPVTQLSADMERLFDTLLTQTAQRTFNQPFLPGFTRPGARIAPPLNVWENDQNIFVEAELPGLTMGEIELLVQGDQLTLRGERQPAQQQGSVIRHERWMGQFERTVTLPAPVDQEHAEASLQNGILSVTLPKAPEARPRKIEIRSLAAGHKAS